MALQDVANMALRDYMPKFLELSGDSRDQRLNTGVPIGCHARL